MKHAVGFDLAHTFLTSFRISSARASSISRIIFWFIKLTDALLMPLIFLTLFSISAAQFAQSRSSSLIIFFIS